MYAVDLVSIQNFAHAVIYQRMDIGRCGVEIYSVFELDNRIRTDELFRRAPLRQRVNIIGRADAKRIYPRVNFESGFMSTFNHHFQRIEARVTPLAGIF